MKIIDGLKLTGDWIEIPDCVRDDLPGFFKEMGYKTGVEIGVWNGDFTELLAKTGLEIYGVDPWAIYDDYGKRYYVAATDKRMEQMYQRTVKRLALYKNCKLIRKTSMEAVKDFADESLDFVYLDGNHGFKYVAEDLWEWTKKLKKGGAMTGHDYAHIADQNNRFAYHVKYVLDAFVAAFKIAPLYILGNRKPAPGEKRDKWRSWAFIK